MPCPQPRMYGAVAPNIYRFNPHFLFYEVVSVIRCVIPYNDRKILEMMVQLKLKPEIMR